MLELWRVTEVVSHSDTHHTVPLHTGELKRVFLIFCSAIKPLTLKNQELPLIPRILTKPRSTYMLLITPLNRLARTFQRHSSLNCYPRKRSCCILPCLRITLCKLMEIEPNNGKKLQANSTQSFQVESFPFSV